MHKKQRRWATLCVLGLIVASGLTACMFAISTPQVPTLILGEVAIIGHRGELLISVTNMPDSGLASVAVDLGGITYDITKISNVTLEGLFGFKIVVEQFVAGDGGFVAVQPSSGLPGGVFIKLCFDVTGDVSLADFQFTKADFTLADDNHQAFDFEMTDVHEFYAI
jgi:hypothetical protein